MNLCFLCSFLLIILHHSASAIENVVMKRYEVGDLTGASSNTKLYDDNPTWQAIVKVPGDVPLKDEGVREYAASA